MHRPALEACPQGLRGGGSIWRRYPLAPDGGADRGVTDGGVGEGHQQVEGHWPEVWGDMGGRRDREATLEMGRVGNGWCGLVWRVGNRTERGGVRCVLAYVCVLFGCVFALRCTGARDSVGTDTNIA